MTPAQADRRIMVSRQRLAAAVRGGDSNPTVEIEALQGIAEEHPGKAIKIGRLIGEWTLIADRKRGGLH